MKILPLLKTGGLFLPACTSGLFTVVAVSGATGDGGNLTISTPQLIVTDGGQVSVSTFGEGDGGDLSVNATDSIEVSGSGSGLFASVELEAMGAGGNITISTPRLTLTDDVRISANNFGEGNGGELNILTGQLQVDGGSQISAFTVSTGNAGNVTVNATESIALMSFAFPLRTICSLRSMIPLPR